MPDIFDQITDIFDATDSTEESSIEKIKSELTSILERFDQRERKSSNKQITAEITSLVKAEVAKIKPVQNVIHKTNVVERTKEVVRNVQVPIHMPPPPPPQKIKEIIKEIRIEAPKETKTYAEEKTVQQLKTELAELKQMLQNVRETLPFLTNHGGSGVVVPADPAKTGQINIGNPNVNGSWRIIMDGTNLSVQQQVSGTWTEKGSYS